MENDYYLRKKYFMLSNTDYQNLWNTPAPNGFRQAGTLPPSYHEYVQREI